MQLSQLIKEIKQELQKVTRWAEEALKKASTFRAHPAMLDAIKVDYHGIPTPIKEIASIDIPSARTLRVKPWEKELLDLISKAIYAHNRKINKHDLTPENTGQSINIVLPPLTEEFRKSVADELKKIEEQGKRKISEIRRDSNKKLIHSFEESLGKFSAGITDVESTTYV